MKSRKAGSKCELLLDERYGLRAHIMLQFLRLNLPWLLAPMLLSFLSGFGQTFFLAIFGGSIREKFALSQGDWGQIYMAGTLAAAVAMMSLGSLADKMRVQKLALMIVVIYAGLAALMAVNSALWVLPVLIFGLRFCGQGMMMHLSQVVTARWFLVNRAKAMSVAILGIAAAEALFPMIFARLQVFVGWQITWISVAIMIVLLGWLLYRLLAEDRAPQQLQRNPEVQNGMKNQNWTRQMMLKSWVFWCALIPTLAMPFMSTVFFFQIPALAEEKGWSLLDLTALIPLFTLVAFPTHLLTGLWIDRYGIRRVMSYVYLPLVLGYFLMAQAHSLHQALFAILIMGLGQGSAASVSSVFWPDFYGTKHIGAIRALVGGLLVCSTALGPWISGALIDQGLTLSTQFRFLSAYAVLATLLAAAISLGTKHMFSTVRSAPVSEA